MTEDDFYFGLYGAPEDGAPIEVNGPDVQPIPSPDQHTLTIQNGLLNKPIDYQYTGGKYNQQANQAAEAEAARQAQAVQQQQTGASQPVPSGPHTDKFDYDFSDQQRRRIASLQEQKQKVMHDQTISPAQRTHLMTAADREISQIAHNPIAVPKKNVQKMPNGQVVGVPFTDEETGIRLVTDHQGNVKPLRDPAEHLPTISEIAKIRKEVADTLSQEQTTGADGKKTFKTPTKAEIDEGVKASLKDWMSVVETFRKSRHPGANATSPDMQSFLDGANQLAPSQPPPAPSPAQTELNDIRVKYKKLSQAPQEVQRRYWELKSKLGE